MSTKRNGERSSTRVAAVLALCLTVMGSGCVSDRESELTLDDSQTCVLVADLVDLDGASADTEALQEAITELREAATRLGNDLRGVVNVIADSGIDPENDEVKEAQQSLRQWSEANCIETAEDRASSQIEGADDLSDPEGLQSPGSRPELEPAMQILAAACLDGTLDACDDLWLWSESGSDLEQLAATCGARSETRFSGSCSVSFDPDLTDDSLNREEGADEAAMAFGTDPGFDLLIASCRSENGEDVDASDAACELLYLNAPTDSQYEIEAQFCGGRSPQLVFEPCNAIDTDSEKR